MGGHDFAVVLKTDAVLGRYLAAARNIKPGELLLRDDPIIMCPNAPTDNNTIVCFGCCGITAKSASLPCNKCGWPLCSTECEKVRTLLRVHLNHKFSYFLSLLRNFT